MSVHDSKLSYDEWHLQHEVDVGADAVWHQKVKELADSQRDFAGRRVLEIACGRGGFACWLVSQSFSPKDYIAADFSTSAVKKGEEYSRQLGFDNIHWKEADIQAIPYPDNNFDTVISCETIEHVPNPELAVRELARVLRPGGRLFLTTPNYFNVFGIWRGYRRLVGRPFQEAGQPINKFVMLPRTLSWVRRAGLIVENFGSVDIVIPRFKRPPLHIELPQYCVPVTKWFGLQSYVVASKPGVRKKSTL